MGFCLGALLLGALLALAGSEGVLRLAGLGYSNAPFEPHPTLHHIHPPNYRFRFYSPHMPEARHEVCFDGNGFRILPAAIPLNPEPYRLAVLGDSFAVGLEVPSEKTAAGILAGWGTGRTQVKTFGTQGYSPVLEELQWGERTRDFQPTHAVLILYGNDVPDDHAFAQLARRNEQGRIVAVPYPHPDLSRYFRWSYLARFVRMRWIQWRETTGTSVPGGIREDHQPLQGETLVALTQLRHELAAAGTRLTVTAVPSKLRLLGKLPEPAKEFADLVKDWAQAEGVDYLDLTGPFRREAQAGPLFFQEDIHWNEAGHRVVAEEIRRHLPALFQSPTQDTGRGP